MSVSISGILLDPFGEPASFAEVKFITWQGANDVLTTAPAVFKTSSDGAYSFAVEFGTFTVQVRYNQSNGKFQTIKQKVIVNSNVTATTLGELLLFNEPLTPPEIAYVEQLVAEAEGYKDDAAASAAASEASSQASEGFSQASAVSAAESAQSAADAANSAALIAPVPLNGGVWASGQTYDFYNQYMIYNGEAYSPLPATVLPYTVGAAPDLGFVYQIKLNDHSLLANLNAAGSHDPIYSRDFQDFTGMTSYTNHVAGQSCFSGANRWSVTSTSADDISGFQQYLEINVCDFVDCTGVTDSTAWLQDVYNIQGLKSQRIKVVYPPHGRIKVDGTVFFGNGSITEFNNCRLLGTQSNSEAMFETGVWDSGLSSYKSNSGESTNPSAPGTHFDTKFYNLDASDSKLVFKLYKFLAGCSLNNITTHDVTTIFDSRTCYYSEYNGCYVFDDSGYRSYVSTTADITSGSPVITVADATDIEVGQPAACRAFGKIVNVIGISGNQVTLSDNAEMSAASGGNFSGISFSLDAATPLYILRDAVSQVTVKKLSGGARFVALQLGECSSSSFSEMDIEGCVIGVDMHRFVQATFDTPHMEGIRFAAFKGNNLDITSDIEINRVFAGTSAGIACMVDDGGVGVIRGNMNVDYTRLTGYTPYAMDTANGLPLFVLGNIESNFTLNLTSPSTSLPFGLSYDMSASGFQVVEKKSGSTRRNAQGVALSSFAKEEIGYRNVDAVSPEVSYQNTEDRTVSDEIAGGVSCRHKEFFDNVPERSGFIHLIKKFTNASVSKTEVHVGISPANTVSSEATARWFWRDSNFDPFVDGVSDIGSTASNRVRDMRIVNAPIVGSDYRIKSDVKPIPQELLDFAMSVEIQQYTLKGRSRTHYGIVITERFLSELRKVTDLDLCAAFCHDVFTEEDENGNLNPVTFDINGVELGDLWQVRYDEWQNILLEAMRRKVKLL